MTVREKIENILFQFGMFEEQAHKVMNVAIPKINELSDDYEIEWDSDCDIYEPEMYNFLFSLVKKEALEWIDKNVPKAWFRENFVE
jgi:hypothetical protein